MAPLAWVWGVRGRAISHPRPLVLSGVWQGPTTNWLWVRGVGAWGPVTDPTARALASWLCALWRRHEGARGGHLLPRCGASGDVRSSTPDHSSFQACGRGPLPTGRGCGVRAWGPGCPWHLLLCRSPLCVLRASRVRGNRWPLWLGTCPRAVVVAGGVLLACLVAPRWCAAPRPVRSLSVLWSAFPSLWCLPPAWGLSPPALLGGCAGNVEAGREPGSLCLPLAPAEARALGTLRVVPVRGPALALSLAGPSGFGVWLRALRLFACVDPVTDRSGFPYRPSFDGGLGRCTGAASCGCRHLPFLVGGRHARVPRVYVCLLLLAGSSGPASRPVLVRLTFSCGRPLCALGLFGPLRAGVALFVVVFGFFSFLFLFLVAPRLSLWFRVSLPAVPWALASCGPPAPPPSFSFFCPFPSPPPPRLFFFSPLFCFLFVCRFFFCSFLPWCAGSALFGLVCVSCAVGCPGVCCCGPCAPAGTILRLCCVVGCSPVVPELCVLLPVLRRCRGVYCVLPGTVWRACVGLGSFPVLLPPVAVAWSPVVAPGCVFPWGAVLRCSGGRLSCGVVLSASCLAAGAVLFRSRRRVLFVVACGCRLFVAGSGCLLLFSAGVCCRGCSCLAAWPAALLCAVVCCGAPLPCCVSFILWCCVAVWCRAVPPRCQ